MLEDREWTKTEGARPEGIRALADAAPEPLPKAYLQLLADTNGGEGPLPVQPLWLVLYPAEEVAQIARDATFEEFFPGLFVIGGNGGGEAIAIDFRGSHPSPIVAFDMTNSDIEESVRPLAASFEALLDMVGRDTA